MCASEVASSRQLTNSGYQLCIGGAYSNVSFRRFTFYKVDLMYGKGFDLHGELLDLGCNVGLLSKSGAW